MVSSKKRVLCFISSLGSGGAERQLVGLAAMLKKSGYTVRVTWYDSDPFYEQYLIDNDVERGEIKSTNVLKQIIGLKEEIRNFKADIVIAYLKRPSMYACILKAMWPKFKLIVSERNTTFGKLTPSLRLKFFLFKFADWIVPNSLTQGNFIKNKYPAYKDKIYVINNYADLDYFKPPIEKCANSLLSIIVAARITEQKNVKNFMKAVKLAKNNGARFIVKWFGDPYPLSYKQECEELLSDLQISEMMVFYPATKNILHEYQNADVFCLPSIYEGFPNVIGEAMSCGLPIICSDVSDNATLVKENVNGFLFDPLKIEDIASILTKISQLDNDTLVKMGMESRKMAEELLTKNVFIGKYCKLIEST